MSVQAKPSDTTVKLSESGGFAFGVAMDLYSNQIKF